MFTAPKPDITTQPNNAAVRKSKSFGITVNLFSDTTAFSLNVVTHPAFTCFPFQEYFGVDLHKNKIEMGKNFGLTHGIVANSSNLKNEIYNIVGDKGPEITFETTGNARIMEQAYELTPNDGKTIFVGVPNDKISIYSLPLAFNKTLAASHGGNSVPDKDIPRYVRLIKNKKISLEKLITHEFDLSEINKAIALFRNGKAGRIILKLSKEK